MGEAGRAQAGRTRRGWVLTVGLAGCGGGDENKSAAAKADAIADYAAGVHASYEASLASATALDEALDAFVAKPTTATLDAARAAWLTARDDYVLTEPFRFYGGPIDDETTGIEGLVNAWPLDEAYVDYVEGNPGAGVINDPTTFPTIDRELVVSLNEKGGEANISTGWHAIEFLLWGQDLDENGAGARPLTDYTSSPMAERRATYLTVTSDLLIEHLESLVQAWAPDADNYRADFEALEPDEALRRIITGIGELSRGELAGERMNVAYSQRSQEDEHSCFSDNTTKDIVGNAKGIAMVVDGTYPGARGAGVAEAVAAVDEELAAELRASVSRSVELASAIPAPFDQHLREGVPDDSPGRKSILATIESLEDQADVIVAAADKLGITVKLTEIP